MKTIEEKAKRYDEAIDKIADVIEAGTIEQGLAEWLFPELKESEDEKIRKTLIRVLNENVGNGIEKYGAKLEDALAWLEKQDTKELKKTSIWKHWKDGICGNGEGKLIYLIKCGDDYSLTSCLAFECDYIELSELDDLIIV